MARRRVALVFGGRSSEHGVSCVSAGSVLAAIDRAAWDVVPIGVRTDGRWVLVADEPAKLAIVDGALPSVEVAGPGVVLAADPTRPGLIALEPDARPQGLGPIDVVFPLLHGPYGEDGTVQGLLELADLPYVGSGVLASAAAMDKAAMKALLASAGLPVGPYRVVPDREWQDDPAGCLARVAELGLPVFVKPARAGSSMGITKVTDLAELPAAIEAAREHDPKVVVELAIDGREIECGVLEDAQGGPTASSPAEIRVVGDHEFYDFEAKYLDGSAELDVPADVDRATADRIGALALDAFRALGCEGLARVDFFLAADGGLVVNEVNTMPGFTPTSMYPRMWAASGVEYPQLVDRLLRTALARRVGLR